MKNNYPRIIKALRLKEISVKMAFMYIGVLFAFPPLSFLTFFSAMQLAVPAFFSLMCIYCFNAGFGHLQDGENPRLNDISAFNKEWFLKLGLIFLLLSLTALYFFGKAILITGIFVIGMWLVYSIPRVGFKNYPFSGFAVAFFTQIAQFHIGYMWFKNPDLYSLSVSIYFAMLVAAGHLLHEIIDYEADKTVGIETTAVYLGIESAKKIIPALHVSAFVYFMVLSAFHFLPFGITLFFLTANIAQGVVFITMPKIKPTDYRRLYLMLYVLAALGAAVKVYFFSSNSIL